MPTPINLWNYIVYVYARDHSMQAHLITFCTYNAVHQCRCIVDYWPYYRYLPVFHFTQYRCIVIEFVWSGRSHASQQFSWQCFGIANEQCFYVEFKIQRWALVSRHCSWLCILLATANIRISRINFVDILWKRLYNCLFSALFSQAVLEMTRSWSSYSV